MAGRLDPPHERVTLSVDELVRLAQLEREFALVPRRPSNPDRACPPAPQTRWQAFAASRVWRFTVFLLPLGVVVALAGLASSVAVVVLGAALAAVGLVSAALCWVGRDRQRRMHRRRRRRH